MNDILTKLANSSRSADSSDHLKLLGKRAAGMFVGKEATSLTEAVSEAVSGEELNKDQIRRVAEMANQATWNELFMEGGQKDTSFAPASADEVLSSLAEHAGQEAEPVLDYFEDPGERLKEVDFGEVFKTNGDEEDYPALNPHSEAEELKTKVAAAEDLARFGVDRLQVDMHTAGEKFYQLVKQAHLRDGHGILQISRAVGEVLESSAFGTDLMTAVTDRMKSDGVKFDVKLEQEKLASAIVVNTEHPLMETVVQMEQLGMAIVKSAAAYKKLQDSRKKVSGYLRDKYRGV